MELQLLVRCACTSEAANLATLALTPYHLQGQEGAFACLADLGGFRVLALGLRCVGFHAGDRTLNHKASRPDPQNMACENVGG